ncbi:MAG: oligosaccharide flippase family protein [Sideroxydans sp.]|nr:oligosaccharide flippase family protein [Sideroxydans sp.]
MSALNKHGLANLAMLFISKAGGVLVVLLFMPMFYRTLGAAQFGVVAVILSLQALLVMLDLGMSTMVGREVAVHGTGSPNSAKMWRNAEVILSVFYLGLLLLAGLWGVLSSPANLSGFSTAAIVLLFWAMVLQNLGQTVLLGAKSYLAASTLQLFGALFRAAITLIALQKIAATVPVFIAAQLITTLLQLALTRWVCVRTLMVHLPADFHIKFDLTACKALLKQGKPLLIFGLAGAAVMQLDKPIIAAFISAQEVSTYFLAVTFCMTPIAVLAGPVSQYFQPKLLAVVSQGNSQDAQRLVTRFAFVLLLVTVLPSASLWFYRDFWVSLWLGDAVNAPQVILYIAVLLPGVVIGALGYIPFAMLTAQQDYHFQARLSASMTVIALLAVIYLAAQRNVYTICWVYAAYHIISTIASWLRSVSLVKTSVYAKDSLYISAKLLLAMTGVGYIVKLAISLYGGVQYQAAVFSLIMLIIGGVAGLIFLKRNMHEIQI